METTSGQFDGENEKLVMISKIMKVVLEALPDWLLRREKWRSAALLGHSGPRRTGVRLRSSFGRALHPTPFDDADVDSKKFIQSGKVPSGAFG